MAAKINANRKQVNEEEYVDLGKAQKRSADAYN